MKSHRVFLACTGLLTAVLAGSTAITDRCLYIPPGLADRVLFYHPFGDSAEKPAINALGGICSSGTAVPGEGVAGKGVDFVRDRNNGLSLTGISWPLHKPITVMLWWRVREGMNKESGYELVSLNGEGYISNFVRSGPWCALTEPTFVMQVWRWPGITNVNGIQYGNGWVEKDVWHHAAVVVSGGATVSVWWDGKLRSKVRLKGRAFRPADVISSISIVAITICFTDCTTCTITIMT